jgi:hypothetical protein
VVRNAVRAVGRLHRRKTGTLCSLICGISLLAGCGGSGGSKEQPVDLPLPSLPAPIRVANCTDWRKGSVDQRRGTVVKLRTFAGGPVGSSGGIQNGPVLDDTQAYTILNGYCSKPFARGFQLYKLYVRAAGFVGQQNSARSIGGGLVP